MAGGVKNPEAYMFGNVGRNACCNRLSDNCPNLGLQMKRLFLLALPALLASTPALAEVDPIEIESFAVQQAPIQQVYLLLMTQSNVRGVKSSAHSTFPMPDINQCEKEGKRWKTTAIDGINGNDKSYYCVKGSR